MIVRRLNVGATPISNLFSYNDFNSYWGYLHISPKYIAFTTY